MKKNFNLYLKPYLLYKYKKIKLLKNRVTNKNKFKSKKNNKFQKKMQSKNWITIWDLNLWVEPLFIGQRILLYGGYHQKSVQLIVTKFMVGFRFAEFIRTRQRTHHTKKNR